MTARERKILALYKRGLSMREIGERCGGISKQAVNATLRKLGAPRREPPPVTKAELSRERRLSREAAALKRDAAAVALIRAGDLTYEQIAARLEIGETTVQGIANRHGIGPGKGGHATQAWEKRERHEARNARIVRLIEAGRLTYAEIGARFGLAATGVSKVARNAGLRRSPGGRAG